MFYRVNSQSSCHLFLKLYRNFHTSNILWKKNHYNILGITPKATQNEVKSAYYKLSMIYHPDKNKDSSTALSQFRDITEAYEVLGNYKLRKLYDKGIIHTAGPRIPDHVEEDDAETKFYKSRQFRHRAPPTEGATPIYDFDEWTKAHYGRAFERRQNVKFRYNAKVQNDLRNIHDKQAEKIIAGILTATLMLYLLWPDEDWDNVKTSQRKEM